MRLSDFGWEVLMATSTEDDYGLHEIVDIGRRYFRTASLEELRSGARLVLDRLLTDGFIKLYRRSSEDRTTTELTPNEVQAALASPDSWKVPAKGEDELVVGATELGEKLYYSEYRSPRGREW